MSTPQIISVTPAAGGSGTTVAINGTGLSSVTGVALGGTAVPQWSIVSDAQITFVVPSLAAGAAALVLTWTGTLVDTGGFAVTGSGGNGGPGPNPPASNEGLIIGALAVGAALLGIVLFGRKKE